MAGVNWNSKLKLWRGRVYEPTIGGAKGKEHTVGWYDDEAAAAEAVKAHRLKLGLPEKSAGGSLNRCLPRRMLSTTFDDPPFSSLITSVLVDGVGVMLTI